MIHTSFHTSFLPSLFGRTEPLPEELKEFVSRLSPAQGGIGIPDLKRESLEQFNASLDITAPHVNSIVTQSSTIPARELMEERMREINAKRSKVCRNVETEPLLQPLDNEVFNLQSTVTSREARLDMKAGGFWTPGVTAFFDVRVTHVNSRSNQGKYTATIFKEQENEKRKYNQRVMDVEMGTFTPLVFGANGGMGLDCQNFLRTLARTFD